MVFIKFPVISNSLKFFYLTLSNFSSVSVNINIVRNTWKITVLARKGVNLVPGQQIQCGRVKRANAPDTAWDLERRMTDRPKQLQFRCINCGRGASDLFKDYNNGIIKMKHCVNSWNTFIFYNREANWIGKRTVLYNYSSCYR